MQQAGAFSQRQWRNRPVLREIDSHRVRRLWRVALAIAMALTPWTVYLLQQNERLKIVYEVNALRSEMVRLQEEERRLNVERARLESLAPIERWAVRSHGLTRPGAELVFVAGDGEPESEATEVHTPTE
jgi:hypothetical protein